jgi:limonene-1,2-epoxide hydrolase
MTDNEKVALEFLGKWEQGDAKLLASYFTPDALYLNMPLPPRQGVETIEASLRETFVDLSVRIETLNIASAGDLVFTERIDWVSREGKPEVRLPVAGVMEMRDGKIAVLREYFDLRTVEEGLDVQIRDAAIA